MRDLMAAFFIGLFVMLAINNPFAAFLLWTWVGLIAVDTYLYGFMRTVPLSMLFAGITLMLILISDMRQKVTYRGGGTVGIMVAIALHGLLCAIFAYPGLDRNWELYSNMLKTLLLCVLMPFFLINRRRLNMYVMLLALGISFHGLIDGLKFISSGGHHNASGIPKLGDNNHYGLVLLMGLPLLTYVYRFSESRVVRWIMVGVFLVTFLAVLATDSRGAMIAAGALGIWVILMSKRKLAGLAMMGTLVLLVMTMASDDWFARMDTIKTAQDDLSFMGRVTAWKRASAIAIENPLFGGGYHAGQAASIFEQFRYKPGLLGFVQTPDTVYPAATHSIYFEVLGDLGFVGLLLFLMAIGSVFYNWWRIQRFAAQDPVNLGWASEMSNMVAASMVAYATGGAALSAAYFELPYYLIMLMFTIWLAIRHPQEDLADDGKAKP